MGWGDELMAAGQARKAHELARLPVEIQEADGSPRFHEAWRGLPFILKPGHGLPASRFVYIVNGRNARPYCENPLTVDTGWRWTAYRSREQPPVIALDEGEREIGQSNLRQWGEFAVIEPDGERDKTPNQLWGRHPRHNFAALVELMPDLTFVHVGRQGHPYLFHDEPANYRRIFTRTFREAAGVLSGASFYVGGDGGLVHAARALDVPAVVIYGGCASAEALGYPENINLVSRLPGTPCGRYLPCEHCRQAMEAITPEQVAASLTVLRMREQQRGAGGHA